MGIYCDYGYQGVLSINAIPLAGPAWDIPLLMPLWMEFEVRGDNLVLPGAQGRRSFPRRLDEATHTLNLWVNGYANQAGTLYTADQANSGYGLAANLAYLWTNVFAPVVVGDGVLPATLTMPTGATTRVADVQVTPLRMVGNADTREQLFTFTLTIPAGRFV